MRNAVGRAPAVSFVSAAERAALAEVETGLRIDGARRKALRRLLVPFDEALKAYRGRVFADARSTARRKICAGMLRTGTPWWVWTVADWRIVASLPDAKRGEKLLRWLRWRAGEDACSLFVGFPPELRWFGAISVARGEYGRDFDDAYGRVRSALVAWGFRFRDDSMRAAFARAVLDKRGLSFSDGDLDAILRPMFAEATGTGGRHQSVRRLARAFRALGWSKRDFEDILNLDGTPRRGALLDPEVPKAWLEMIDRYLGLTTMSEDTRKARRSQLFWCARWFVRNLRIEDPALVDKPACLAFTAGLNRAVAGEYASSGARAHVVRPGRPLSPNTQFTNLSAMRQFIDGLVAFDLLPPERAGLLRHLRTPRSLQSRRGPKPRVVDETVYAKLLNAALTMAPEDVPSAYPFALWRALALVWLFCALRNDEIRRVAADCVRDLAIPGRDSGGGSVCWLDVPESKTLHAFCKPIPREAAEAIKAWAVERPAGQTARDRKSGEQTEMLFMYRGRRVGHAIVNERLIPLLCRLAGVPESDSRGKITSHRARSTMATLLYNAEQPMGLFQVMEWLGQRDVRSTQHYVLVSPKRLAQAYGEAMEAIGRVATLVDVDAVRSGAPARGEPWLFHDVEGGLCSHDAYDACPHRMACAKCSFHVAEDSPRAKLLRSGENVRHLVEFLTLSADESEALTDEGARRRLRRRLAKVAAPDGSVRKR